MSGVQSPWAEHGLAPGREPVGSYLMVGKVKVFYRPGSPWVEVEVPGGALAIWAATGAVHPVTECGAVTDEPLQLPFPNDYGLINDPNGGPVAQRPEQPPASGHDAGSSPARSMRP